MSDIHECFNDPAVSESFAASNLAELLDKLTQARSERALAESLTVSVSWLGVDRNREPSEAFRRYITRRLTALLPSMRADWIASLEQDVVAARANLAEIQARK